MAILKSREERNSFINKVLESMEDIHYASNEDCFNSIDNYTLYLYKEHDSISKLNSLIDEALDLEKELRELTSRYRAIKDRVVEVLNSSSYFKLFKEHYEVRTAIFDSRRIRHYRDFIVQREITKKYGDVFFDRKKHRITILDLINKYIRDYDSIDRFINFIIYEYKEYHLEIFKTIDKKDEQ